MTATVNDTYTVTSAAAAENPGKFDVFHGGSSIRSVTQKPWYGYKFKEWVLDLGSGQEQALPVDKTITSDLTFKAKYEETSAVLTYVPYPDTIIGKVQETGGAVSDRVQQNVLSVSGAPASVTALPATGYAFDYWTKDSPDGDHITGQTITATQDTEEGTGRKAFNNHTYYAHFKTYDVTVKFIVHEDYPNGELSDVEGEPVDTHQFTVQSNSQFKIEAQTGTYGNVGLFKIWAPGANVETDDPVVIEQISSNNTEQHYLTWLRAKLKAVPDEYDYDYSSLPSPQILNDPSGTEYIFAGVLQQRGQTEYHIRYWQEKVDAAVTDNPLEHHPYTSEYYTQEGDDVIATGTKGQQMVYDPKSYEGFNIQKVIYTPTDKLIPEEGTGYVDIYYDRQEDYEFVFRSRSQTPENAAARVLDPELPKEYETTWESLYDFLSHDEADKVPWSGIYGAKFIAFDTP
ncbi:MAG: hypothetical protein Q4F54_00275 [Coriobacteriia bacterium]|nr:hypothetical protein [Coriobacteriia bacterium]